jgi:hypothetical protein
MEASLQVLPQVLAEYSNRSFTRVRWVAAANGDGGG